MNNAAEKKTEQNSDFRVQEIRIHEMVHPLGLDEKQPSISWILESEGRGMLQKKAQILVGTASGLSDMWDSTILETGRSIGISYAGKALLPETRYFVTVRVWNQENICREAGTWFETGLLNPGISAWEGARWIGAPEYCVAPDCLSVFELETTVTITEGTRAGIVFGANDQRLMDRTKNEMLLEGENYIRYVLDVSEIPAQMQIFRVGYDSADRADVPLASFSVCDAKTGEPLITEENRREPHKIVIRVEGNGARVWVDDHPADAGTIHPQFGFSMPRTLNPLGNNDVTTYPRLCDAGCYVGTESLAVFGPLRVRNIRKPCQEIMRLDQLDGKELSGTRRQLEKVSSAGEGVDPAGGARAGEQAECSAVGASEEKRFFVSETWDGVHYLMNARRHSIPMLRRNISLRKRLVRARLYATARGIYECSINGKRVGDEYFAPGASQYDKTLLYQTYDVTGLLQEGENGLGCILASGWWCDSFSFRLDNYNYWGDRMSFLAKLSVVYEDGSREVFTTNEEDWSYYGEGPYRYAGFFNGEQFDARKRWIAEKFSMPDFDIMGMKKPEVLTPVFQEEKEGVFPGAACWPERNASDPAIVGNDQAPVREAERFTAKSMTEPAPGVYLYDLEQEIAGVPSIVFHEKKGTRVVLRYGEMLYPPLERYGKLAGMMLQANLREASNTDIYICSGEDGEVYQPRFTFHGYRYIEISGVTAPPALTEVQGLLLSSVQAVTGRFSCSNDLINRFVTNVKYSQLCNFISIPTDCPQRNERMGWMGDTHIFCRTATYQADVKNFYLRNLQAMKDLQTPEGRLPSIAPFGGGFGGMTYESGMILMVWELYQQYGDSSVVDQYYDSMKKWMEVLMKKTDTESADTKWPGNHSLPGIPQLPMQEDWLGDWLAPEPTDPNLIYNAFHYRNAVLMERFAGILGKTEDEKLFAVTAEETREYWNQTFVEPETGLVHKADGTPCDVQGSYAIGLGCGVFAEKYRERAYAHLARKVQEDGYTIRTGFFGTGMVNSMLSKGGYEQAAVRMMTQTAYPSWLYPVTQGATTIWERWNSFTREEGFGENNSMNSFNHYSLGCVLNWLYENILGIRRDETAPGYRHFILQPEMEAFVWASGGIETPHGRIESSWRRENGSIHYACSIPANTTAELYLGGRSYTLVSGSYEFELNGKDNLFFVDIKNRC